MGYIWYVYFLCGLVSGEIFMGWFIINVGCIKVFFIIILNICVRDVIKGLVENKIDIIKSVGD